MQVNGVTSALRPTTTACALWDEIWDGRLRRCWTSPAFLETRSLEATICPTRSRVASSRDFVGLSQPASAPTEALRRTKALDSDPVLTDAARGRRLSRGVGELGRSADIGDSVGR
jgi:hypothetical protein